MKAVTKLNTQPQDAESTQGKVGYHSVTRRKKEEVSGVVRSARLCVICQHVRKEKERETGWVNLFDCESFARSMYFPIAIRCTSLVPARAPTTLSTRMSRGVVTIWNIQGSPPKTDRDQTLDLWLEAWNDLETKLLQVTHNSRSCFQCSSRGLPVDVHEDLVLLISHALLQLVVVSNFLHTVDLTPN